MASCHTYPAYPSLPQPTPQHGRRSLVSSDYIRRADVLGAVLCCDCSLSHPYPYPASASAPPARLPASSRLVSPRLASSRFACSQLFSSVTVFSYARLFSFPIRLVVSKSLRPHHTPLHAFSHIPSPTPFLASFLLASFLLASFLLAPHPLITSGHTRRCQSSEDCFRSGLGFGWYLRYIHDSAAAAAGRASSSCPACFGCFDTYAYYDRIDRMPIFGWYYTPIQ